MRLLPVLTSIRVVQHERRRNQKKCKEDGLLIVQCHVPKLSSWLIMVGRKKKVQYEHVYGMMRDFALISVTNGRSLYTMANRKFYYTATIAV